MMKIFQELNKKIEKKYLEMQRSHRVVEIRHFDFETAEKYFEQNKESLIEFAFTMGFDENVYEYLIYNGEVVYTIKDCKEYGVSGVKETCIDYPCFYCLFKNGKEIKNYCYYFYNSKNGERLGKVQYRFGMFEEEKFLNTYNETIENYKRKANRKEFLEKV